VHEYIEDNLVEFFDEVLQYSPKLLTLLKTSKDYLEKNYKEVVEMIYLVTLKPLEPYFFGGDLTFGKLVVNQMVAILLNLHFFLNKWHFWGF